MAWREIVVFFPLWLIKGHKRSSVPLGATEFPPQREPTAKGHSEVCPFAAGGATTDGDKPNKRTKGAKQ